MRRFAVAIQDATPADDKAVAEFCRQNGAGWWHRISNFWLLTVYRDDLTIAVVRDKIVELTNRKNCVVIEVMSGTDWATFGPTNDSYTDWFKEEWTRQV